VKEHKQSGSHLIHRKRGIIKSHLSSCIALIKSDFIGMPNCGIRSRGTKFFRGDFRHNTGATSLKRARDSDDIFHFPLQNSKPPFNKRVGTWDRDPTFSSARIQINDQLSALKPAPFASFQPKNIHHPQLTNAANKTTFAMPLNFSTDSPEEVAKALTTSSPRPAYLVVYASAVDGRMWCGDCRDAEPFVNAKFGDSGETATVVYAGLKPECVSSPWPFHAMYSSLWSQFELTRRIDGKGLTMFGSGSRS